MTDYKFVLRNKYPTDDWSIGDEYDSLIWSNNKPKPSQKELDDAEPILVAQLAKSVADKATAKQAVLDKLGLTADEVTALFG